MRGETKHNNKANLTISVDEKLLAQLKEESEKGGQSINAKTNMILTKYLQFYSHVEAQRGVILPLPFWKEIIGLVDEKKMIEIFRTVGIGTVSTFFELYKVPRTIDNLTKYFFEGMSLWAGAYWRFTSNTDREGNLRFVFEHDFGIKWSRILGVAWQYVIENLLDTLSEYEVTPTSTIIKIQK